MVDRSAFGLIRRKVVSFRSHFQNLPLLKRLYGRSRVTFPRKQVGESDTAHTNREGRPLPEGQRQRSGEFAFLLEYRSVQTRARPGRGVSFRREASKDGPVRMPQRARNPTCR